MPYLEMLLQLADEESGIDSEEPEARSPLLDMPDDWLLPILQRLAADDQRSLCSAARAHSRLHKAAVRALCNITAILPDQEYADSMLAYLDRHGRKIESINLANYTCRSVQLRELAPDLQLTSLKLDGFILQLQPDDDFHGVLGGAAELAALSQPSLSNCNMLDRAAGTLADTLAQLPAGLEHLTISDVHCRGVRAQFPTTILQKLQQLTHLELAKIDLEGSPAQEPLHDLTRLVDLQLDWLYAEGNILASMLSGAHHLTRLHMASCQGRFEPGVLAGMSQIQHLDLDRCFRGGFDAASATIAQLMSQLQHMQQLTHPSLTGNTLTAQEEGNPPDTAYSVLTASSKLQHLNITGSRLPANVWQHVFPPGMHLPHLKELNINSVRQHIPGVFPTRAAAPAPDSSLIVSCCTHLRSLKMQQLQYSAELLAPLTGLSELQMMDVATSDHTTVGALQVVPQLSQLRYLDIYLPPATEEGLLLKLTQLKQLTALVFYGPLNGTRGGFTVRDEVS
jgi:hypothetical protein